MPSSVVYDPDSHTILITLAGVIDEVAMNSVADEARALVRQHACYNVLTDMRQAVSAVSTVAIFARAQQGEQLYRENAPQAKRAIVVEGLPEDAVFYETVSRNRGQNVQLFQDMEEARRWLSS